MKSVQLENGHVRIANPIVEALALAPFSAAQLRIVMHVIRMSYGWQRSEAEISLTAYCAGTGLGRSTAHAAVKGLVDARVLEVVRPAEFRTPAIYRLQKDPRKWAEPYRCNPPSLASDSTGELDSTGKLDSPEIETGQYRETGQGCTGKLDCPEPQPVAITPVPEAERQTLKTDKDIIHLPTTTRATREADATRIITAANEGMAANPVLRDSFRPIDPMHGSRSDVIEWLDAGIPPDVAADTVRSVAAGWKPSDRHRQISTMRYFTDAVHEEQLRRKALENTNGDAGSGTTGRRAGRNGHTRNRSGAADAKVAGSARGANRTATHFGDD
jgi:phage replication O-like protein O